MESKCPAFGFLGNWDSAPLERVVPEQRHHSRGQLYMCHKSLTFSMSTHVKIALLICGGLSGKALTLNGDYYDVYLRYLTQSCPKGVSFSCDAYNVKANMEFPAHEDDYSC